MPIFSLGERRLVCKSDEYFIAPTAAVIGAVKLGHQSSIWFNCVLRGDGELISIGDRCNIQDASVLHVDPGSPLNIGDNVSIGHKVMLHGCTIGEGSLIGMNAVILNDAYIGKNTLVGAHSLVPEGKRFPDGVLLLGSPAKVVRKLTPDDRIRVNRTSDNYVQRAAQYRNELKLERP